MKDTAIKSLTECVEYLKHQFCVNFPQIRSVLLGKMKGAVFSNLDMLSTTVRERSFEYCAIHFLVKISEN
jgi:hypothetical protein